MSESDIHAFAYSVSAWTELLQIVNLSGQDSYLVGIVYLLRLNCC
jgi:hypothetical protein